jgi:TolB protein
MKNIKKIKLPKIKLDFLRNFKLPRIQIKQSWLFWIAGILIAVNLILLFFVNLPAGKNPQTGNYSTPTHNSEIIVTSTQTPFIPTIEPTMIPTELPVENLTSGSSLAQGTIVFSMVTNGYSNIYSFQPGLPGFLRITSHPWDDMDPMMSPDGSRLAYSSKQNGYWNIYILDLINGIVTPVTDDAAYDGHPVWSPDGSKLLIETYIEDNFQLQIIDLSLENPIKKSLTSGDFSNYDGSWSPDGRYITYVSNSSGVPQIWMMTYADGQHTEKALAVGNINNPTNPVFSPDGSKLAWSAEIDGQRNIFVWDRSNPGLSSRMIGLGSNPAWSPDGQVLFCVLVQPQKTYLTAYALQFGNTVMPPFLLPFGANGLSWSQYPSTWINHDWIQSIQQSSDLLPYRIQLTPVAESGRFNLVPIPGQNLEYPYLHDMVDESFVALQNRMAKETGWDVLANIQSAFLPLSQVAEPDGIQDWLYTGRAFKVNPVPLNVGWMALIREDFGSLTYWRILIRPLFQDGSMGRPYHLSNWNISSRFNNDPAAYEQGGKLSQGNITGYWVDFTDIAQRYKWDRFNALSNWVSFYPASRFNLFANTGGLSINNAMLELYPPEIFVTPTLITLPTITPTNTPKPKKPGNPTSTLTPTITLTIHPTWTPLP